ncbi:MAG: hypothetical protein WCA12_20520 [Burkholderiales bacterium]
MEANMDRVVRELRRVVADAEGLLEARADRLGDTREAMAARLHDARHRLHDFERKVTSGGRRTARQVDDYARGHPWQIAGIGVALATAAAFAAWLLLDSRRD